MEGVGGITQSGKKDTAGAIRERVSFQALENDLLLNPYNSLPSVSSVLKIVLTGEFIGPLDNDIVCARRLGCKYEA
jgi:hypothetical protein